MGDRSAVTPRRMQQDSTTRETPGKRHTTRLTTNGTTRIQPTNDKPRRYTVPQIHPKRYTTHLRAR